jgi:hypothetical protein
MPDATTRQVHGGGRRALDGEHRNLGELGPAALGHRDRLTAMERTDRCAGPAEIGRGRHHAHVVAGVVQRPRQRHDPG